MAFILRSNPVVFFDLNVAVLSLLSSYFSVVMDGIKSPELLNNLLKSNCFTMHPAVNNINENHWRRVRIL